MPKDIEAKIKATKPQTMSIQVEEYNELREQLAYWKKNAQYWDNEFSKLSLEFQEFEEIEKLLPDIRKFIEGIENHKYTTLAELQEHIDDEIEVIKASLPAKEVTKKQKSGLAFNDDVVDALHIQAPQLGVTEQNRMTWNEMVGAFTPTPRTADMNAQWIEPPRHRPVVARNTGVPGFFDLDPHIDGDELQEAPPF